VEAAADSSDAERLLLIEGSGAPRLPDLSPAPMPRRLLPILVLCVAAACQRPGDATLPAADRTAIADSLTSLITTAYDLSKGNVVDRLMSLYPDSGRVVSAAGGRVSTTRDSLEMGIRYFWDNVGRNMREPRWTWGPMHVDVLSRDAAVVTTTYLVPHIQPDGAPHTIGGAWTMVFARRGGRWAIIHEHLSDLPAPATAPR
jgi:ketosteroid isomerase-like protein